MSRLDYVTIAIIVICAAALGFLIYRTVQLRNQDSDLTQQEATNEDSYQDYDYNYYQDTTEILPPAEELPSDGSDLNATDNAQQPTAANTEDNNRPVATYEEPVRTSSQVGEYLVLAGSFSIKANAEGYASELRRKGYGNAAMELFNKGAYAVVMVDRFSSESDARKLVQELKNKGIEAYVHQKRETE